MLILIAQWVGNPDILNLLGYITFRSALAAGSALLLTLLLGSACIRRLGRLHRNARTIRDDVPDTHKAKKNIPSMGGLLIIGVTSCVILITGDLSNILLLSTLLITLVFTAIGVVDDYCKLTRNQGIRTRTKFTLQLAVGLIGVWTLAQAQPENLRYDVALPFVKDILISLPALLFCLLGTLVIVGCSNAVNLTDGLDGLAAGSAIIALATFGLIAYLTGNAIYAEYLLLHPVPASGELSIFCSAFIGALLGFLWFNAPPASVFMGDTGSLAIGAGLGTTAIATKHELVLVIVGGLFVIETLSVILQVLSFKLTGKRLFLIAPIHHHFEKSGWSESQIVVRFWIIAAIFAMIGLATLKLR